MERPSRQLFKAIGKERLTSAQRLENDTLEEWKSLLGRIPFSSVSYDSNGFNYNGGLHVHLCHQDRSDDCFHDYFSIDAYFRSGGIACIESCEVKYVEGGKISKFEGTWEDAFLKLLEIGNALARVEYDCRYEDD